MEDLFASPLLACGKLVEAQLTAAYEQRYYPKVSSLDGRGRELVENMLNLRFYRVYSSSEASPNHRGSCDTSKKNAMPSPMRAGDDVFRSLYHRSCE